VDARRGERGLISLAPAAEAAAPAQSPERRTFRERNAGMIIPLFPSLYRDEKTEMQLPHSL
jgi:hypothetical protein